MSDNAKPSLVVILSRFPYPLEKGDKLRAYNQIKEMSCTFSVHLICISDYQPTAEHQKELDKYCTEIHVFVLPKWRSWLSCFFSLFSGKPLQVAYFHTHTIQQNINKILHELKPSHIFCQLIRVADYVKNYHDCAKTLDYMDAFSTGIERRVKLEPFYLKWLFRLEFKRLNHYELQIYDYFEIHTIISEQDKELLGTLATQKIQLVANGVSEQFFQRNLRQKPNYDLVFVGNLSYPPNVEAVKFVVHEILPLAKEKGFPLRFLAAGAYPVKSILNLAAKKDGFDLFANPVDIREAYSSGKIFVAPMKIGTGLQNKLLESMALGIPSITTFLSNNALKARPGKEILIAETAEDFLAQINSLNDNETYKLIAEQGSKFVETHFKWPAVTKPLIDAIKNAQNIN